MITLSLFKVSCKSLKSPGRSEFAGKKWYVEMSVAYIKRLNRIQEMRGYKVFECAISMPVVRQNTLLLIIAPPSGGNSQ